MATNAETDRYAELCAQFGLRPIKSDEQLERAIELAAALDRRGGLSPDEEDYLEVLLGLIEAYEDAHHPFPDAALAPEG